MTETPAGWYPDPTPPTALPGLRYWDGQAWTEHVAPTQEYAAQPAGPTTPDGVPLAGWGIRLAAYLIDVAPIWLLSMVLSIPAQVAMQDEMRRLEDDLARTEDLGAFWDAWLVQMQDSTAVQWPLMFLVAAYFIGMWRWKGATLGKLALGLRVRRREQPGRLPWSTILLRFAAFNAVGFLPSVALFTGSWALIIIASVAMTVYVFLDLLWPLWDSKRQALHDKVARTNVVKIR